MKCRGDLGRAALLAGLILVFGLGARAQQPTDAPQGPDGYDATQMSPNVDPPTVVARLSVVQGNVSVEPASVNQFSPAEVNYPLTNGDRVWTDYGALAELQGGQLAVRLGQATDLTVTAMTDTLAQFGLGQGIVHLRTYQLDPAVATELDTPNVAVTVLAAGDVRVEADPNGDGTVVTVYSGVVQVDGNGLQQTVGARQSVRLYGSGANPVSAQWLVMPGADGLDAFSGQRDQMYESAVAAEQGDLNMDTVGGGDLQQYGSWSPESDYGAVWFPASVPDGWQPYCYGRWTWLAPWGWTWIDAEPWGFAPFHYGRWAVFGGKWGWIPGPPVVHPVYAPALVVFVHPGNGVSAWFPLGPNEPYAPWYHSSALYLNRVNVSNLYNRNVNQVRTVYDTSNREVYANPLTSQRQFANRSLGTVTVPQASFAGGKSVRQAQMHLPPQQLAAAPVLPHPMVTPERGLVAQGSPKALPIRLARPTLTSHEDQAIRTQQLLPQLQAAEPQGQAAPVERRGAGAATQPQGEPNQIEYRNTRQSAAEASQKASEPENVPQESPVYANPPQVQPVERSNPAPGNAVVAMPPQSTPTPPASRSGVASGTQSQPSQQGIPGMTIKGGERPPAPVKGTERLPNPSTPSPRAQMPYDVPQQLYNRAVPPPPRPGFELQRQAIQATDPGRPLSPQQLDNLRDNRPAGQPQQREAAPHPASAPPPSRSEPAPQRSNPPQQPQQQQRH